MNFLLELKEEMKKGIASSFETSQSAVIKQFTVLREELATVKKNKYGAEGICGCHVTNFR